MLLFLSHGKPSLLRDMREAVEHARVSREKDCNPTKRSELGVRPNFQDSKLDCSSTVQLHHQPNQKAMASVGIVL